MRSVSQLADEVLNRVGVRAEAEVHVTGGPSALTRFANSFIHQNVAEESITVSVRLAVNGKVASGSTTNLTDEGLDRVVDDTVDLAGLRPIDEEWPGVAAVAAVPDIHRFDEETADVSPAVRAGMVRSFVDAGPEMRAAGFCETEARDVVFANTAGQRIGGGYTRVTLDGIHQSEVVGWIGPCHVVAPVRYRRRSRRRPGGAARPRRRGARRYRAGRVRGGALSGVCRGPSPSSSGSTG